MRKFVAVRGNFALFRRAYAGKAQLTFRYSETGASSVLRTGTSKERAVELRAKVGVGERSNTGA